MIRQDEYGTVINHLETYEAIAEKIQLYSNMFIAWSDGHGSQLDILFSYQPTKLGPVQGGLHDAELFISVTRHGAFGFDINDRFVSPEYVGEKLGLGDHNQTTAELAELINGVRNALY